MLTDPRYYNIRWLELMHEVTPRVEKFGSVRPGVASSGPYSSRDAGHLARDYLLAVGTATSHTIDGASVHLCKRQKIPGRRFVHRARSDRMNFE